MLLAVAVVIIGDVAVDHFGHEQARGSKDALATISSIGGHAMSSQVNGREEGAFLVGFVAIVAQEAGDYQGAYLCIDELGAPVECRYTTPVKPPSRAQTLLYGEALEPQLLGRCIAGALLDSVEQKPRLVLTNREAVVRGSKRYEFPIAEVIFELAGTANGDAARTVETSKGTVLLRWRDDRTPVAETLFERLRRLDLSGPFERIRSVLAEIRKTPPASPNR